MKSTTDIQMSKMPGNSFNDIYTSYYKKSFFFAKSYVHNDLAAEDIASEALIKLWEKLKAESVEEKYILPLLLTILKNKALDYILCPVYILHVSTLGQLSVHSQCGAQGMGSL